MPRSILHKALLAALLLTLSLTVPTSAKSGTMTGSDLILRPDTLTISPPAAGEVVNRSLWLINRGNTTYTVHPQYECDCATLTNSATVLQRNDSLKLRVRIENKYAEPSFESSILLLFTPDHDPLTLKIRSKAEKVAEPAPESTPLPTELSPDSTDEFLRTMISKPLPCFPIPQKVVDSLCLGTWEGRPVLLAFLSPNCPHCRASIPVLNRLAEVCPDLWLLGVVTRASTEDELNQWAQDFQITFPLWAPDAGTFSQIALDLHITDTPMSFLLDRGGKLRNVYRTELTRYEERIRARVRRLCGES